MDSGPPQARAVGSNHRDTENDMTKNMGDLDRRIRGFLIAPLLVVVAWLAGFDTVGGVIAVILAAVMAGTATVGTCPLYLPLHIDTDRHHHTPVG